MRTRSTSSISAPGSSSRSGARLAATAAALLILLAGAASAKVYATKDAALARAFPGAVLERLDLFPTEEEVRAIEARAKRKLESRVLAVHRAAADGKVAGYAMFGTRLVRTKPAAFMIAFTPEGRIRSFEILAFHEPEEYLPAPRWFGLFGGRALDADLEAGRGISAVAGATLSVNAFAAEARLALAALETLVLAKRGGGDGR